MSTSTKGTPVQIRKKRAELGMRGTIRTCERASTVGEKCWFLSSSRKGEQLLACFGPNDLRAAVVVGGGRMWLCRGPLVRTRGCVMVGLG